MGGVDLDAVVEVHDAPPELVVAKRLEGRREQQYVGRGETATASRPPPSEGARDSRLETPTDERAARRRPPVRLRRLEDEVAETGVTAGNRELRDLDGQRQAGGKQHARRGAKSDSASAIPSGTKSAMLARPSATAPPEPVNKNETAGSRV